VSQDPHLPPLREDILPADPLELFSDWLKVAEEHSVMSYPNSLTLSTLGEGGYPDGRIVLLKGVDERGFIFYTNFRSAKGRAMEAEPRVGLTFYWDALGRQVRVRGRAERVPDEESDAYFAGRPRGSQLGALASFQSETLEGRGPLEERFLELERRYEGETVPRPEHWGGYVVRPVEVEFWQAAEYRLHDRFLYRRVEGDGWSTRRLYP